jgi:hypothetical protein
MSNNDVRVLNRMGARELTQDESQRITGGANTLASVVGTGTPHHFDELLDQ